MEKLTGLGWGGAGRLWFRGCTEAAQKPHAWEEASQGLIYSLAGRWHLHAHVLFAGVTSGRPG